MWVIVAGVGLGWSEGGDRGGVRVYSVFRLVGGAGRVAKTCVDGGGGLFVAVLR